MCFHKHYLMPRKCATFEFWDHHHYGDSDCHYIPCNRQQLDSKLYFVRVFIVALLRYDLLIGYVKEEIYTFMHLVSSTNVRSIHLSYPNSDKRAESYCTCKSHKRLLKPLLIIAWWSWYAKYFMLHIKPDLKPTGPLLFHFVMHITTTIADLFETKLLSEHFLE